MMKKKLAFHQNFNKDVNNKTIAHMLSNLCPI